MKGVEGGERREGGVAEEIKEEGDREEEELGRWKEGEKGERGRKRERRRS